MRGRRNTTLYRSRLGRLHSSFFASCREPLYGPRPRQRGVCAVGDAQPLTAPFHEVDLVNCRDGQKSIWQHRSKTDRTHLATVIPAQRGGIGYPMIG